MLSLVARNLDGKAPSPGELDRADEELLAHCRRSLEETAANIEACRFRAALQAAMGLAQAANRYLEQKAPWRAVRENPGAAATTLWTALATINCLKTALCPFLPFSSERLHRMLGLDGEAQSDGWTWRPGRDRAGAVAWKAGAPLHEAGRDSGRAGGAEAGNLNGGSGVQATSIYAPIHDGLDRVETRLRTLHDLDNPFLGELMGHVFDSSGKRVRPAITLLAAGFHPAEPRTIETMAAAVEMLHIATLIHDDTIDDSTVRRGRATVGSLWGRKAARAGRRLHIRRVCDAGVRHREHQGDPALLRDHHGALKRRASGDVRSRTDRTRPGNGTSPAYTTRRPRCSRRPENRAQS